MKKLIPAVVVLALLAIGGLAFIYLGVYDIAANRPHSSPTLWIINLAKTQSVKRHARGITAPDLSDPSMVRSGGYRFQLMCVQCHGGPGMERSDAGDGLYPQGPDLSDAKENWAPRELFWITKNGLKMTGMPAWGHAISDEEIWNMTAFMERLSAISPDKYQQMLNEE